MQVESFILLSPGKKDVRKQKHLNVCLWLWSQNLLSTKVLLIVLDFQSLYPSIRIGYNYCYSTMIGRVEK
ncbi:AIF_HP2_G0052500.mRNA.1.CDS.1 [Saccharomyces cerevisiae]|nr:AIF_HP2_G0052500.mRNA.1.CDS.1 [Saccharomyces cerevisiae]CAI6799159.1 AIF_HP2_G0052500.mRNA.1.CDS.1 [Saccharomyces cerevisiae]